MPSKSLHRKALSLATFFLSPPAEVASGTRHERRLAFLQERRAAKKLVRQLNAAVK